MISRDNQVFNLSMILCIFLKKNYKGKNEKKTKCMGHVNGLIGVIQLSHSHLVEEGSIKMRTNANRGEGESCQCENSRIIFFK